MRETLKRTRLLDVCGASAATTVVSVFPFATVCVDNDTFQPAVLRNLFLCAILAAWPFLISAAGLSLWLRRWAERTAPGERVLYAGEDDIELTGVFMAAALAFAGCVCLLVAQSIWVYVASKVAIVWVLALVVVGLALLFVVSASLLAIVAESLQVRAAGRCGALDGRKEAATLSERVNLDILSPQGQKVVADCRESTKRNQLDF